jgi:hypothetical protein
MHLPHSTRPIANSLITGLRALDQVDVPLKTSDQFTGRTLNNTFKMLNMFALIERNEHDFNLQSSESSKGTKEILADNIDVIRVHSAVQGFFADTLHADKSSKTFALWLDRAVRVFCCSYDMASERITRKTNAGLVEDYRLYEIHGIRLREHIIRHEKKIPMPEAFSMLNDRLARIQSEIDRRTPESSSFIAGGGPQVYQASIFDRTSSSSDTGPETPGDSEKGLPTVSTWGFDPDQSHFESPTDIMHRDSGLSPLSKNHFPPHVHDDLGYESDLENTAQPSPQTVRPQGSPISSDGPWETVPSRRRPHPARLDLGDHRTTRNLGRQKYSDRAGSFRSLNAIDPRAIHAQVTRETARGYMHNISSGAQSRARPSGQSSAEVALAHISHTSPPPAQGGGAIQNRSLSQRSSESGRVLAGAASYAAAVSGYAPGAVIREADRPVSEPQAAAYGRENRPALDQRQSSAMQSLQRFPVSVAEPSPVSNTPLLPYTPMPPYPSTPGFEYQLRYPESDSSLYELPGQYSQESLRLWPDPSSSHVYPRLTGQVPFEPRDTSSAPKKHDPPRGDFPTWHSQTNPGSLQSSLHAAQTPPFLSLSSPNIRPGGEEPYYPGRPEFSSRSTHEGGYTSQPMSRDPSGQSAPSDDHSHRSYSHAMEAHRRSPSLAETEPPPQLPDFSPRIAPTSYEVYEEMRNFREKVVMRRSPRLEFEKLSERLDEWNVVSERDDM